MNFIKKIDIRKFRSIKDVVSIQCNELNIFVGLNDQGKSNILRALNLFFNNETDIGTAFRFSDDYCFNAPSGKGSTKEIKIEILITPPKERFKLKSDIKWIKRWKQDGSIIEDRIIVNSNTSLSSSDNVSKWLDKVRFRYVPAIKSQSYFESLMGDLHDVLNLRYEEEIAKSGGDFIFGLQQLTNGLTLNLNQILGIPNTLQTPSDFKALFASLNFGSHEQGNIFRLNQRGDGIKIRHIPIILEYMAREEKNLSVPGYVKPDTIWGFEEPENNLELRSCFNLADSFLNYANELQIFVTTHSPAFYSLMNNSRASVFYVKKNQKNITSVVKSGETHSLNEEFGLLDVVTPYIQQHLKEKEILSQELEKKSMKSRY